MQGLTQAPTAGEEQLRVLHFLRRAAEAAPHNGSARLADVLGEEAIEGRRGHIETLQRLLRECSSSTWATIDEDPLQGAQRKATASQQEEVRACGRLGAAPSHQPSHR